MPEMRRARPKWVSWIPTAIVALLIAAVGVTSAVLINNGVGQPVGAPTEREATEDLLSVFSEEGIAYIETGRKARFNLAPGQPIDSATLELPDDGAVEVGPTPTELDITIKIYGGGAEPQGVTLAGQRFTVTTADGELSSVAIPQRESDGFRNMLAALEKRAPVFGWDAAARDDAIAAAQAAQAAGTGFEFDLGRGIRLGMGVEALVTCTDRAWCSLEYVITPER